MNAFSVGDSAKIEIQRLISSSGCKEAVISLSDVGSVDLADEAKLAILDGDESELNEIRERAVREVREGQQPFSVVAAAYERRDCAPDDLTEISGLPFAMTVPMREALRNYTLLYENGEFMLQSPEEIVSSLRTVKNAQNKIPYSTQKSAESPCLRG